ncbi:MAG: nucleotidyltransferase family protein, partial [Solirubrobacteraceae bacterium]
MLLGAGRGTRLASLGLNVPKILVDVGGEPLLARQLRYLAREGAERVVVNAHHLAEQVEDFAAQHTGPPELVVVTEPELLGTAGGVRNALPLLGSEPFVVLYGDVLTDAPLAPLLEAHARSGAAATLAVYESQETEGKGTIEVDSGGRIVAFREKQAHAGEGPTLINAGLYVLNVGFVTKSVPEREVCDFGHRTFPRALENDVLRAYRLT